jgi:hypothetical protein
MAVMMLNLEQAHISELQARLQNTPRPSALARLAPGASVPATPISSNEELWNDPTKNTDVFIHRCIGTVRELEEHLGRGGAVFLQYPDGTMRELTIDATQDGASIPTGRPLAPRRKSRRARGPR